MKKLVVLCIVAVFMCAGLISCSTHERCAAYGKINKVDSANSLTDKTEKPV